MQRRGTINVTAARIKYGHGAKKDDPKATLNCWKHPAAIILVQIRAMRNSTMAFQLFFKMHLETKLLFFHRHCCLNSFLCSNCRRTLFLLKLGSFQFAVLKLVFTILSIVLYTNGTFDLSDVSRKWHSIVSIISLFTLKGIIKSLLLTLPIFMCCFCWLSTTW